MATTYDMTIENRPTIEKGANDRLDYSQNWSKWLAVVNDTLATVEVVVEAPLIVDSTVIINAGIAGVFIKGGIVGKIYKVTFNIITAAGRKASRSIFLKIVAQ